MKALGVLSTTALFLLLGAIVPAYAQEEHHEQEAKPEKQQQAKPAKQEEAKPAKQEERAKPEKQQEQAKPAKQEEQAKGQQEQQQKHEQEQAKSTKQQEQKQAKGQQEQQAKQQEQAKSEKQQQTKQVKQEERGNNARRQHAQRTPDEEKRQRAVPTLRLSVRNEGRIPDDRFRSNFGRGHEFRIGSPRLVDGYSRFQYGGFWFGFVQPWPVAWYYTDDVYVDFIDGGYYLCNPYYPDERVSIVVVM
ncbi:MAG: hypothetical protein WB987_11860 [Candidatus Acidiferrales bacterium]